MPSCLFDRSDYPSLRDSVYLNQASLGLIGRPAVSAMHSFIDDIARHGNLHMTDSDEVAYFEMLRERAGKLFQADSAQVAIVASASEMLGQLPLLLDPPVNKTILAVASDFPSVTRPWLRQVALKRYKLHFVEDESTRDLTDALIDAVNQNTGVVAVSSVQYATGTVVDISRLRLATSKVGARLIVDATQAAGAMRVNAADWNADAVVTSGYKWLGGHGGVALAVMSRHLLAQTPASLGWMSAPNPFQFDATSMALADDARRYTQSTMSYVSMAGLSASIEQLLSLGEAQIETHARTLATMLIDEASRLGWQPFRSIGDPAACPHIISLGHSRHSMQTTVKRLRGNRIVCGTRGGRLRISLAPYNDTSDVYALIKALGSAG